MHYEQSLIDQHFIKRIPILPNAFSDSFFVKMICVETNSAKRILLLVTLALTPLIQLVPSCSYEKRQQLGKNTLAATTTLP